MLRFAKPAQPESKARGILLRDSDRNSRILPEKHVAGDQKRPESRRVIARIHLLKKNQAAAAVQGRRASGIRAPPFRW